MMYTSKLAVAIKVNGKVLREGKSEGSERDDTVYIPFGSEYTLYVKNMNSVRALVRVSIDGTDATENVSIIVLANSFIELERFVKADNMSAGLKFKFIERTQKIEDGPRGIKVEDGLIRVEYEFEREPAKIVPSPYILSSTWKPSWTQDVHHHHYNRDIFRDVNRGTAADITCSTNAVGSVNTFDASLSNHGSRGTMRSIKSSMPQGALGVAASADNEKGITVGGSKSEQEFHYGSWFPTDGVKHVMIIKIFGETGKGKVEKAVTVKTKIECPTCGTKNKHGTKFCRECGTGLEQV